MNFLQLFNKNVNKYLSRIEIRDKTRVTSVTTDTKLKSKNGYTAFIKIQISIIKVKHNGYSI